MASARVDRNEINRQAREMVYRHFWTIETAQEEAERIAKEVGFGPLATLSLRRAMTEAAIENQEELKRLKEKYG